MYQLHSLTLLRSVVLFAAIFLAGWASRETPNLDPSESVTAANYWCTGYAQNFWQQRGGEITDFDQIKRHLGAGAGFEVRNAITNQQRVGNLSRLSPDLLPKSHS